ncbi:N-6 DNA methylase [Fusobacterium polymorphum]|uniref:helix-turn-helix domain-containing protein n=1 Tax=Fusobacterium nucleatum subsp. polymorphum TaxID=76857 RepID=UPI0030CF861F
MEFISIQDVSTKWNISKRRVQILCQEGRIDGAKKIGNMWVIPENAARPTDARIKSPVVEKKKVYSEVRRDLKKILKTMYRKSEKYEMDLSDKKTYVLSILAGVLCSSYIEVKECVLNIINHIFFDISRKKMIFEIDEEILNIATDFIRLHQNDKEIDNIVSWAYQYSNKIVAKTEYSHTQFFTESYMINFLLKHINELTTAKKILDLCVGGGNFLVECLELLSEHCTSLDVEEYVISYANKLFGYDIDRIIARIAVVNIRIKAMSIIQRKGGNPTFDIWKSINPNVFCALEKDTAVGSLAKDNKNICNVITGKIVDNKKALGNAEVIVTNPPFVSVKGVSNEQKEFLKNNYPLANCDTCVAFIEAINDLLSKDGVCGIVSQNAWMHLKSFKEVREKYIAMYNFRYIANLGSGAFLDLSGEKSNISLIVFGKRKVPMVKILNLSMISLSDKIKKLETKEGMFEINQKKLNSVNGFILSKCNALDINSDTIEQYNSFAIPMQGTSTGNSKELVGFFWEHFGEKEWIPVSNGGGYCRWEGLNNSVVKWGINGEYIKTQKGSALRNIKYFDETQLVFSDTGTAGLNVRLLLDNQIFIASGPGIRVLKGYEYAHMAFLNSRLAANFIRTISPKLTIAAGYIGQIPAKKAVLESSLLEQKARLCVELKRKHLQSRPNNFEYVSISIMQIGSPVKLEQQAWELLKSDLLNELLKLEIESQCDEIILSEYSLDTEKRNALSESVGECAFCIKSIQEINISKFDRYLVKILDDACMLKRSRTSKVSLGCDGILEYVSKDLNINPENLVGQISQSAYSLHSTLEKYINLIIHNYVLQEMGYSVTTGLTKKKISCKELANSFENIYGKQIDILNWLKKKFNLIHNGIFKGKPFIYYEDGEIKNGKQI